MQFGHSTRFHSYRAIIQKLFVAGNPSDPVGSARLGSSQEFFFYGPSGESLSTFLGLMYNNWLEKERTWL